MVDIENGIGKSLAMVNLAKQLVSNEEDMPTPSEGEVLANKTSDSSSTHDPEY